MNCNYDCFNCPHPDCINDRLEFEDFHTDYDEVDRLKLLARNRNARYRAKHKEILNKRSRDWNNANKERVSATTKAWQQENKQRIAATKRKRWAENPEYYRQKQREYRARRKDGEQCRTDQFLQMLS